jgi:hypothetical protein
LKRTLPPEPDVHESLRSEARRLSRIIRDQSHVFKKASLKFKEDIVTRQVIQARIADSFIYLFGMVATLARLDSQLRQGDSGVKFERDRTAALHYLELATLAIESNTRAIWRNADESMLQSAHAALRYSDTKDNALFVIPEKSPSAAGTGRIPDQTAIRQFPGVTSVEGELETIAAGRHPIEH